MFPVPTLKIQIIALLALVISSANSSAQVLINEIFYDPADVTKRTEFIELHNAGANPVDISGWHIEEGVDYVFPAATSIPAGGFLCVAQDPAAFLTRYSFSPLGPWIGKLSNSGERLQLKDAGAAIVDELNYGVGFPWPTAARGGGQSMELIHPSLDNTLGGSWRSSVVTADTPVVPRGAAGWRYRETRSEPPATWKQLGFDDSSPAATEWLACTLPAGFIGTTPFTPPVVFGTTVGFGGNAADKTRAYYFRKKFTPAQISALVFNIRRDDGAVMWLNDDPTPTVISAENATWVAPFTYAGALAPNATAGTAGLANYASFTIPASKFVAGENVITIQLHQSSITSGDLLLDAELVIPGASGGSPGAQNSIFSATAPPQIRQVTHAPEQPAAGVPVLITARITDPQGVASATLGYQLVDPGSYIRKTDAAYATTWTNVAMNDAGADGDVLAADGIFSATLPAPLQTNRRLVRYRISASDGTTAITVPYADDDQPNFAYFVYNGVPAWSGAVLPGGAAPRGTVNAFTPALLNTMQTWQIITNAADHDNMLYTAGSNGVRFFGTFVYEGKVYDHIQYHNRGIGSTYVSGKNKFALFFNRARDVRIRDDWGKYFNADWNSIPVDACASPWAAVHRGMAGVEEALGYRLYELAGMASLRTTYLHLRVVRGANEAGTGQYDTDFWGLYMALEPTEGNFLDERALPDGNVYAIEGGGGDKKHQGPTQPLDTSDWNAFTNASVAAGQTEAWYRANMDLDTFTTFFALNRFCGNVDVRPGDNYRYYHRPTDNRWLIIPYDLDMMSLPAHHWGGTLADGVVWAGASSQSMLLSRHTALAIELRNRARELSDLLATDNSVSGGQIVQLIDEYAQMVNPTGLPLTWADADEALWGNHPRTQGGGGAGGQTSHKNNFFRSPFSDARGGLAGTPVTNWTRTLPNAIGGYAQFEDSMNYLKNFMTNTWPGGPWLRSNGNPAGYGYKHLEWESLYGGWGNCNANPTTPDLAFPNTPAIAYAGPGSFPANALDFTSSAFSPATAGNGGTVFTAMQWRIGEISAPGIPGYVAGDKRKYEVQQAWTSAELPAFTATTRVPLASAEPGKTYRARVRHKDANGRWSHWSAPVQFIAGVPDVSAYTSALVVSEVNYNPAPVTPAEFAAGYSSDDFEWVELKNVGAQTVDLTDVRFTKGIDFDFTAGFTIPAGGFALVVKNQAAFERRWGTSHNAIIAGTFPTDNFSNGSELVKLSYGVGTEILSFTYMDVAPWPTAPDGTGRTLTLQKPSALLPPGTAANWRASYAPTGTPGADDLNSFALWAAGFAGITDPLADSDSDGVKDGVEYALFGNPNQPNAGILPATARQTISVLGVPAEYLTITFTKRADTSDLLYQPQYSTDLASWTATCVLVNSITNADCTVTETWRAPTAMSGGIKQLLRLRVL